MPRKQELFDELRKMASKDLIRYIKKSYHFYPRMHSINFYWKNYSKNIDYMILGLFLKSMRFI